MIRANCLRSPALALAFVTVVVAQTSIASSPSLGAGQSAPATCSTLLTAEELAKAVVSGFKDMGARPRAAGETECPWMLSGGSEGFKTVSVQFYDLTAIKASTKPTLDAYFEMIVLGAEAAASGKKREPLAGIGQKAVFVPTDPQVLAVVQRADGVARIVGNNLTKAQIAALARAVATP
jgi:hypothetical protein